MPVHESPPPSVRIIEPFSPSRPSTSSSPSGQPSFQLPSRVASQLGLDPKVESPDRDIRPSGQGLAYWAGYGWGAILKLGAFNWITPRLKWPLLKPVIRCSVAVSYNPLAFTSGLTLNHRSTGMGRLDHSTRTTQSGGTGRGGM